MIRQPMLKVCALGLILFYQSIHSVDFGVDTPRLQTSQQPFENSPPAAVIPEVWAIRNEDFEFVEPIDSQTKRGRARNSNKPLANDPRFKPTSPYGSKRLGTQLQAPPRFSNLGGGRNNQPPNSMKAKAPKPPTKNTYHGKKTNRHKPKN